MAEPPVSTELFNPISSLRMSASIVEQMRTLVRDRRLRPGDRLPTEQELGKYLGASRVTVREALRVLQAEGVIESRVGARGGSYLAEPTADRLGAGLAKLLQDSAASAAEVSDARLAFELNIVPLVVERATTQDIDGLFAIADAQLAGRRAVSRSVRFHLRVGACAHNAAIDMIVHALYGPLVASLRAAMSTAPLTGEHGAIEHRRFVEAVAARDVPVATSIMRAHVSRTAQRLAE